MHSIFSGSRSNLWEEGDIEFEGTALRSRETARKEREKIVRQKANS